MKEILIDFDGMTLDDLAAIARGGAGVRLTAESKARISDSRALVEKWLQEGRIIYGVTTGFGALSDVIIPLEETRLLQKNILMSHAAGVGNVLDDEAVRAVMALRIKDLARGHSAVRLETVQRLADLLNEGVLPVIPEKGSVGASGDLAPLAHLALVLIGLGEAFYEGQRIPGAEALRRCGMEPLQLEAAEGLALVNGTQVTTAIGGLALYDALRLSGTADIAAAMSLEVLMGSRTEFDPRIHQVRPHPGQAAAADNMRRIIQNSEIISSHKDCRRIQDAYTLRCSPQVHGASKDAMAYVRNVFETEMNASTNNPLIFSEDEEFLPLHGRRGTGKHLGEAHRASGEPATERASRISGERGGSQLRLHDCAIHGGVARFGKQGALPSSLCGFHSHIGKQGGSRAHEPYFRP
jgi:histidine ammonia-lyase